MQSSSEIVAEARTWVGTPYGHAQRLKRVAVDCVGLIFGVGLARGYFTTDDDLAFVQKYRGYSRVPNPARMRRGMEEFLQQISPMEGIPPDGCIGWFQWRADLPMHLAIMATFEGRRTMIHAYSTAERCVENTCDDLWLSRVNSWWVYRGAA